MVLQDQYVITTNSCVRALDAWTRVTVSLFIIQMEDKYSALTQGLKDCLKKQVAKEAEEQEEIKYNLLKKLYISLQSPLLVKIFVSLLIGAIIFSMVYFLISGFISFIK